MAKRSYCNTCLFGLQELQTLIPGHCHGVRAQGYSFGLLHLPLGVPSPLRHLSLQSGRTDEPHPCSTFCEGGSANSPVLSLNNVPLNNYCHLSELLFPNLYNMDYDPCPHTPDNTGALYRVRAQWMF